MLAMTDESERYELVLAPRSHPRPLGSASACSCVRGLGFINGPLRDDPHRVGAPLRAPLEGLWRARRGEYRVRYEIDDDHRIVRILDIDHRRDAYRG